MNILITGASGFIGRYLILFFKRNGANIIAHTRDKRQFSDESIMVIENFEQISNDHRIDAIINLAGAPIDKPWSENYKKILLDSRIKITQDLYKLVERLDIKPNAFISASAVGYYGSHDDTIIDENSEPKNEFTHTLCNHWEKEALKVTNLGCPVFIIRLGVVLGHKGGVLQRILPPFKFGLGGKIGLGQQFMSWIHIHDVARAILFLLSSNNSTSIYNLTAPAPVTNAVWTKVIAKALQRPAFFHMHRYAVSLLFGEMGKTLLLNGQRVLPKKLMDEGFKFEYDTLNKAIHDIIKTQ